MFFYSSYLWNGAYYLQDTLLGTENVMVKKRQPLPSRIIKSRRKGNTFIAYIHHQTLLKYNYN